MPRNSSAVDIVLAVNWPPQAPAPGQATLELVQLGGAERSRGVRAGPSKTSWIVTSRPRKRPGAIDPE